MTDHHTLRVTVVAVLESLRSTSRVEG